MALMLAATAHAGSRYKVLHAFGKGTDGAGVFSSVTRDSSGNLYGTTSGGGSYGSGAVFKLHPGSGGGWAESVLYSFCALPHCADGALPVSGVTLDTAGNVYGTTNSTIFELSPSSGKWTFRLLYNSGSNAGLILDQAGNLYGPIGPGQNKAGAITELSPGSNGWIATELYSFCPQFGCLDGNEPDTLFTWDAKGNLYGATEGGGKGNLGVVFELERTATGWKEHVLHNFPAFSNDGFDSDGGVTLDAQGNIYGTTMLGGKAAGTVFKLSRDAHGHWKETILYDFPKLKDGAGPMGRLAMDKTGNLYGTAGGGTGQCGGGGCGVVFKMTPGTNGKWSYTVLHRFTGPDGALPVAGLILDDKGHLYGTTSVGGSGGYGVVYELTP